MQRRTKSGFTNKHYKEINQSLLPLDLSHLRWTRSWQSEQAPLPLPWRGFSHPCRPCSLVETLILKPEITPFDCVLVEIFEIEKIRIRRIQKSVKYNNLVVVNRVAKSQAFYYETHGQGFCIIKEARQDLCTCYL